MRRKLSDVSNTLKFNRDNERKAIEALYKLGDTVTFQHGKGKLTGRIIMLGSVCGFNTQYRIVSSKSGKCYFISLFDIMCGEGIE